MVPNLRFEQFDDSLIQVYLKDCVKFLDSKRIPIKSEDRLTMKGFIPYYGASGIIDYVNDYIFDDDLILLSEDGANIIDRNYRIAFEVHGKAWINNHAHVLKPLNEYNITYLTEYLESKDYSLYNTGSAQPKLNREICEKIPLTIPSIEEQAKIGKLFKDINERISTQIKIIEDLNIQIKVLLDMFFNDINNYDVYKLNDLGFIYNGLSGKSKDDFGQGLPFIPYTNIYNNNVIDTNLLQYVKIDENENQNKVLKGDILFTSSSETPYEVGIASIYLSDLDPIYLNSFSLGFRLNRNTINNMYLCYLFQSNYFRKIIFKYSQGSTRYNLNREALLNHKIKFHKRDDQNKIVNLLDEINTKIKNESHILKQYEIQKTYLLNNLFI